ncbi:MAG: hypothetical protein QOF40_347 [Actinomycetota bacterium]|jgi:hypothetical protein|nr:hypothetical protein [Actinomycetota bacterium]
MGTHSATRRERRRRKRGLVVLFASILAIVLAGGIAIALWSASGSGSGTTKAITAQTLTVTAAASPTADLYPGASGAVQFAVTNPNPYPVSLTSIGYGSVTSSDQVNCPASNLTLGAGGALGTPISVPASGTSGAVSVPSAVTLAVSAPNGCQGVTFTVGVTLTGTQT